MKIGEFQFAPLTIWRRELRKGVLKSEERVLNLVFCLNYFDYSQSLGGWVSGRWVGGYVVSGRWVGGSVVGGLVVGAFNKTPPTIDNFKFQ